METETKVEAKSEVGELTAEQKAELALKQLQAERMMKLQTLTNEIVKMLDAAGCEMIVEHNIRVVPKNRQ